MYEINTSTYGTEDDAIALATPGSWDLGGLGASSEEVAALYDVMRELDLEDAVLADLEADAAAEADRDKWMDSQPDDQFHQYSREISELGADPREYWAMVRRIDAGLEMANQREASRRQQDAARPARRDEDRLAAGMARFASGTLLPGQMPPGLDFASPTAEDLFYTGPALSSSEVEAEMRYQLGAAGGLPVALQRRQAPPAGIGDLARQIGLR